MSDIFTHCIILNILSTYFQKLQWAKQFNVIELGCGHGYLSLVIFQYLKLHTVNFHIRGIDIHQEAINKCNQIKNIFGGDNRVLFQQSSLKQEIREQRQYDCIIGGFCMQPTNSIQLIAKLNKKGLGIWPSIYGKGQALFAFGTDGSKKYIMDTVFSEDLSNPSIESQRVERTENSPSSSKQKRAQCKRELREELESLLQKRRERNENMSLSELRKDVRISNILQKLQSYK